MLANEAAEGASMTAWSWATPWAATMKRLTYAASSCSQTSSASKAFSCQYGVANRSR